MSAIGCAICVCSRASSSEASDSSVGDANRSDDAEHAITAGHANGDYNGESRKRGDFRTSLVMTMDCVKLPPGTQFR